MIEKDKENRLQNLKGKCIIRDRFYKNSYYDGTACYIGDLFKAKIYNENEIPEYLKNNPKEETIHLDSEVGLKLLIDEIHKLEHYISTKELLLREAKEGLKKLYGFDLIQKYVEKFNSTNHLIRRNDERAKQDLIKRILSEK